MSKKTIRKKIRRLNFFQSLSYALSAVAITMSLLTVTGMENSDNMVKSIAYFAIFVGFAALFYCSNYALKKKIKIFKRKIRIINKRHYLKEDY